MRRFRLPVAFCLAAALVVGGGGEAEGRSSLSSMHTPLIDANLPSPGTLTSKTPVRGSAGERIVYTSTNERGQTVPVSGAVYTPENPKGTVVLAPGTRGMGDQCAPSVPPGMLFGVHGSSANLNYEAPIARRLMREGYRVVVTDYIGLGTPGVHTYLNRIDQGHAVIDAARAVSAPGEKVFFYGYSQGGGATAAAGELAPTYAPELNLVGVFAGAPPADPLAMLTQGNPVVLEGVMSFVIASYAYSYPEFRAALADYAAPAAFRYLTAIANACIAEASLSSAPFERFATGGRTLNDIAQTDPRIRGPLERNRLGNVPVKAPILIVHSPQDNVVPYAQGKQLAADYAALGSPVEFRSPDISRMSSRAGLGHPAPAVTQIGEVVDWMNARFADE